MHCNKYAFNTKFKTSPRNTKPQIISPLNQGGPLSPRTPRRGSNYKYNLFSLLDEQANENCTTGFCTKNEFIAAKIKKKW